MLMASCRQILPGLLLSAALALSGCAQRRPPLYYWDDYQDQVHEYFKGQRTGPEEQIAALEKGIQQARARGATPPPGYHAHLGLLYLRVGKDDQVVQQFETEKALFPESATFMDFLLRKAKR